MAKAGYFVSTSAAVALSAATAKTCLMIMSPTDFGIDLKKFRVEFDGTSSAAVPALVEIVSSTNASNSTPGTGNTSETANVRQLYGRSITASGFTAFSASTSEPTVLTVVESFLLTPTGGTLFYDYPLGDTPDIGVSAGFGIRITAPASVNARCSLTVERA